MFQIDLPILIRLWQKKSEKFLMPIRQNVIFVAESGIKTRADIEKLEKIGVDAVLIGETLMKSENICSTIKELKGE